MPALVFVNPLKPGKLDEYKAFMAEFTGPRLGEYVDLLRRYGLKSSKVYYHRVADKEFVIVMHEAEDGARERLSKWNTSAHPFDIWFRTQLAVLHDLEDAGLAEAILDFVVPTE